MMQVEKERLLTLLGSSAQWCQHAEARDGCGQAVHFNDPAAVAWDLTGAACVLFGWARALELFSQLERQLVGCKSATERPLGRRNSDPQIRSMVAVQEYNDRADITYEIVRAGLQGLSVYHPGSRSERAGRAPA